MALTPGSVRMMFNSGGTGDNPGFAPVVQILQVKKIDAKGGVDERWKVVLSDGEHYVSGMVTTQLNQRIHNGDVAQNAIIKVHEFIVNQMGSGQKVIILLRIDVAGPNPGNRIGAPTDVKNAGDGGANSVGQAPPKAEPMYGNVQSSNNGGYGNNMGGQRNNVPQATNPYGGGSNNPYGGGGNNPYGGGGNRFNQSNTPGQVSSAPIVRTSASGQPITPISGLNMYSNKWTIRAKITDKSEIRTWSNAKGEGSLFSITLLDNSGTDVKCTFFKEAVDKFYHVLQVGTVYTFSGGRLKVANMQYNRCKSQFEITFDQNSEIILDTSGGGDITESYDFVKIASLEDTEPNSYVDILAVVKHVGDVSTFTSKKSGKDLTKCDLVIEDDSGADIRLTVWGDRAESAPSEFANCPVVAFKKARVGDYNGRTLSAGNSIAKEPDIQQTQQLKTWWSVHGNKEQTRSLSSSGGSGGPELFEKRKTVSSIKEENMGYNDKPDYLSFKATITFLKREKQGDDGAWYTACANSGDPCKNMFKATQTSDGNYHCDKCQQTYPNCVRRFIFSGTIADDTSTSWVSVFNEQAESLFGGVTADELYSKCVEQSQDRDLYDSTFLKATYSEWILKCKVKQEVVGDESRVKTSILSANPIDYVKESKEILKFLGV